MTNGRLNEKWKSFVSCHRRRVTSPYCLRRTQKLKETDLASHWIDVNKGTDIPHGHESCNEGAYKGACCSSKSISPKRVEFSLFRLVNDRGRKSFDWYAEWPKFPWYFFWLIRACFGQKGPRFPIILSLFWSKWPKIGLSRLKEVHSWKKYGGRYNSFSKNFKFVLNGLLASAERKRGLLVIHSLH